MQKQLIEKAMFLQTQIVFTDSIVVPSRKLWAHKNARTQTPLKNDHHTLQ